MSDIFCATDYKPVRRDLKNVEYILCIDRIG